MVLPEESRYHTVELSERLGAWSVLEPFVEATKIINVPVLKNTGNGISMATKNLGYGASLFRLVILTVHSASESAAVACMPNDSNR